MTDDWNHTLLFQWEFHWDYQLRTRLEGLTDHEYFWSPVPDAWTVRPGAKGFTRDNVTPPRTPPRSPRSPGDWAT